MKPVKKTARPTSSPLPLAIESILKKAGSKAKAGSQQKDRPPEFILIAAEDVSSSLRAKLLAHGFAFDLKDDLLERLIHLEKENRRLKSLSVTDELTGAYNKRFFSKQLTVEVVRTRRTGEPFCLIFIDLDNFKSVNDTLGHPKGDEFLVKMCCRIGANIRPTDFACRFGGDEFTAILPATSLLDGVNIAKRWHELILQVSTEMNLSVSSSIGIDQFTASSKLTAEQFLNQVDQLLYQAKRAGKGKIVHPDLDIPESEAVTREEKELLYHIFQPLGQKQHLRQKNRGKN